MSPIQWLNELPSTRLSEELLRCCGSAKWVERMTRAGPFKDVPALMAEAERQAASLSREDWLEAFTHHPRIGDVAKLREKFASTAQWSEQEQKGVAGASDAVIQKLAAGNAAYDKKFGFVFLVCATGKSAAEMLNLLESRIGNDPEKELAIAIGEHGKITRLRLEKLLQSAPH